MGQFKAIDQQIKEMGTVVLPYLQRHTDTVWSFIYRSPKTNLVQSKYFIACNEEEARKKMNRYLIDLVTKGDLDWKECFDLLPL